jgi:hypothetical protein
LHAAFDKLLKQRRCEKKKKLGSARRDRPAARWNGSTASPMEGMEVAHPPTAAGDPALSRRPTPV